MDFWALEKTAMSSWPDRVILLYYASSLFILNDVND